MLSESDRARPCIVRVLIVKTARWWRTLTNLASKAFVGGWGFWREKIESRGGAAEQAFRPNFSHQRAVFRLKNYNGIFSYPLTDHVIWWSNHGISRRLSGVARVREGSCRELCQKLFLRCMLVCATNIWDKCFITCREPRQTPKAGLCFSLVSLLM